MQMKYRGSAVDKMKIKPVKISFMEIPDYPRCVLETKF